MTPLLRFAALVVLAALGLSPSGPASAQPHASELPEPRPMNPELVPAPAPVEEPRLLPLAPVRDIEATGRLLDQGIPVTDGSFSPDGFHYAYLHHLRGGFLRRKPQRCAFLLDLGTGEIRAAKTPKGVAVRIGGWDPTGRYLLLEAHHRHLLTGLTGAFTTYHWILDVVTWEFVPRKSFTGRRDGRRFLWKQRGTYHGLWDADIDSLVTPLYEGELADIYRERETALDEEDARRRVFAERVAVAAEGSPRSVLADALPELDAHWTKRSHRDPVVSDLFGHRPALWVQHGEEWVQTFAEVDFVAMLDHGLCLVTAPRGRQFVLDLERWEIVPLPEPPPEWAEVLDRRWNRTGGFYDARDPLPRDLQYRRSSEVGQGTRYYFNYVVPDRSRLLMLYWFGAERRVLRVADLPAAWRRDAE